jgi:hypothetical protein
LAAEEMSKEGISTKAQQALQLEYEQRKKAQTAFTRQQKEAAQEKNGSLKKKKPRRNTGGDSFLIAESGIAQAVRTYIIIDKKQRIPTKVHR